MLFISLKNILNTNNTFICKNHLKNYILYELEYIFNDNSSSLANYKLLMSDISLIQNVNNKLLHEELNYNKEELKKC